MCMCIYIYYTVTSNLTMERAGRGEWGLKHDPWEKEINLLTFAIRNIKEKIERTIRKIVSLFSW